MRRSSTYWAGALGPFPTVQSRFADGSPGTTAGLTVVQTVVETVVTEAIDELDDLSDTAF